MVNTTARAKGFVGGHIYATLYWEGSKSKEECIDYEKVSAYTYNHVKWETKYSRYPDTRSLGNLSYPGGKYL